MDTFAFHPDLLYVCPFEGLTENTENDLKYYTKQDAIHWSIIHFYVSTQLLPILPRLKNTIPNPLFKY